MTYVVDGWKLQHMDQRRQAVNVVAPHDAQILGVSEQVHAARMGAVECTNSAP